MQPFKTALRDFGDALSCYRVWSYMASNDIRLRYRGSTLGPLWITLTMVIFIGALSIVYSRLFNQPIKEYIPFLTCGILIWTYISSVVNESAETFVSAKEYIEGMKMPYFLFIFRMIWRNFLVFLHNFIVYILVVLYFHVHLTLLTLLAIPGFLLVTLALGAVGVILSVLATRFRDLPPIVSAMITVVFFVSPVTWQSKLIGEASLIIQLNPASYLLDLIRTPLLGQAPALRSAYIVLLLAVVLWTVAFAVFSANNKKIPFWL